MKGYKQLNQEQRYTIAQLLKRRASLRENRSYNWNFPKSK